MSKFVTSFARALLNIAGGAIGVGPVLTGGSITPESAAGLAFAIGSIAWGQLRARKTTRLAAAVDAAPALPSAKAVEDGDNVATRKGNDYG